MLLAACKKEQAEPTNSTGDPENEKYYGVWKFTKTNITDSYQYFQGQNGTEVTHLHNETVEWETEGNISKGPSYGELRIKYNPDRRFTAIINKGNGELTCVNQCGTINDMAYGGISAHVLQESIYYVYLGYFTNGGTTYSSRIEGVKL